MFDLHKKIELPSKEQALPGRDQPVSVPDKHFVNSNPLKEPFPANLSKAVFGLGCFWGAERCFWQQPGVFSTAVGYSGALPKP